MIDKRISRLAGFVLMVFFVTAPAAVQGQTATPQRAMRVLHDLQYYTGPGADPKYHNFDLYLPDGKKNFPMLFFVHGGAWRGGDKVYEGLDHIVNMCIDMGMGVMSVNYRVSPAVKHPTHIQDVARAFAWLYKNGLQYGVDRNVIFIAGGSAGAHLVSLLGLDPRYLEEQGLSPKNIKGVMSFSGVYDMGNFVTLGGGSGSVTSETASSTNSSESGVYDMIKVAFGTNYDELKNASPATYVGKVGKDTPPFLITYTDNDMFSMNEQAIQFYGRFVQQHLPAEMLEQPGRLHATKTSGIGSRQRGADDVLGPAVKRFMQTVLNGSFGMTLSSVWPLDSNSKSTVETFKDIRYYDGPESDAKLNALDLYVPQDQSNVPLVFYAHGGAWRGGDKANPGIVDIFTRMGIAVASINYRLSPKVKHPTHIEDVARAFAWVYKNGAQYKIDRNRIVVMGGSSGAHLVSLLAADPAYLSKEGVPAEAIKGVVGLSGVYDFPTFPEPSLIPTRKEQGFGTDVEILRRASPQTYVSAKFPPTLLTFTDWDIFILREQALQFYNALLKKGAPVELVEAPNRTHVGTSGIGKNENFAQDVIGPAITRFVAERVGQRQASSLPETPPNAARQYKSGQVVR